MRAPNYRTKSKRWHLTLLGHRHKRKRYFYCLATLLQIKCLKLKTFPCPRLFHHPQSLANIYIYVYLYLTLYTYIFVYICVYMYIYVCVCVCVCVHTHIHTDINIYIVMCLCVLKNHCYTVPCNFQDILNSPKDC